MHQFVSNLRTIAEPFIVLNNMAEGSYAFLKILTNDCFSIIYEIGGGGVDLNLLSTDFLSIPHFAHSRNLFSSSSHHLSPKLSNEQPKLIYIRACHPLFLFSVLRRAHAPTRLCAFGHLSAMSEAGTQAGSTTSVKMHPNIGMRDEHHR